MLVLAVLTAMLVLAAGNPAPAAADRYRKIKCYPARHLVTAKLRGFHKRFRIRQVLTVRSNRRVWIAANGKPDFGTSYFACWRRTGRGHLLGTNTGGADVTDVFLRDFVLAGRYVAFHLPGRGDENYDRFVSVDARSGHILRDSGRIETQREASVESLLVVTRTGAIAWYQDGVLRAIDAGGERTLATNAGGPITALRVRDGTVYWTQGASEHSTTLQ